MLKDIMTPFDELIKLSADNHVAIKRACMPLTDHFGVNNFTYTKITNSGKFCTLFSHPDWMKHYFHEKLYLNQPHHRKPGNFDSGVTIAKQIISEDYQQVRELAASQYGINFTIGIMNIVTDGLELVGFDTSDPVSYPDALFFNELGVLRKFISHFRIKNEALFDKMQERQVDIASLMGGKFEHADIAVLQKLSSRNEFFKKMGVEIPKLSIQEIKVLKELVKGCSATQIAVTLHLSPRTVEHYLERIKDKCFCFSKTELIQKARELESLGCLETP